MNVQKIRTYTLATLMGIASVAIPNIVMANTITQADTFVSTVPPQGTANPEVLAAAPSPEITVKGVQTIAKFVVDVSKNILYDYDEMGNPKGAYKIATGRKKRNGESLTPKGIRIIDHTEISPYKNIPSSCKRYGNPGGVYGPRIIYLKAVDANTGAKKDDGVLLHGNGDYKSLGKYASKGCMRMDNEVIKKFASEVKKGQYVLVI